MRSSLTVTLRGACLMLFIAWVPASAWAQQSAAYTRGVSLIEQGKYTEALDALNQAIAENPRSSEAYRQRARCRTRLEDLKGALADYDKAINLDPRNAAAWSARSALKRRLNDPEGAWADVANALQIAPGHAGAYNNRGLLRADRGDYQGAIEDYDRSVQLDPRQGLAFGNRGLAREKLNDPKGAMADYTQAIANDPGDVNPWSNRGTLKRRLKDLEGARSDLDRAVAITPRNALAHNRLALVYYDLGDARLALEEFTRSIELDPKQSAAFNNRGLAKEKLKDLDGALADYTRAIENNPKNADAYSNRAFCGNKMGNIDAARQDYQKALAIDPGHKFATNELTKLEAAAAQHPTTDKPTPKPVTSTPVATALPTLKFAAADPCRSAASQPAGLPWQTTAGGASAALPKLPPGIPAVMMAPFIDFNKISIVQYNGAVSLAMEAMRLLYGEMSPEQERQFQTLWAPLFDFPTPNGAEYLNKLNPLLGQFLAGREAFMRAAAAVEAAMLDSALAVAADSKDGYLDALQMAGRHTEVLQSLQAGLTAIAAQIQELGNPPNPLAAKCEALTRYRRGLSGNSSLDGEWVTDGGGRWYFKTIKRYPDGMFLIYQYSFAFADMLAKGGLDASKPGWQQAKDGQNVIVPGLEDVLRLVEEQPGGMLLSSPQELGVTLDGHFLDGERLHLVRYSTGIQGGWTFSGTTYYRAPSTLDTPPLLPGQTWDAVMAVANQYESGRLGALRTAKQNFPTQIKELIAADPDNLPVPPKVRQPWEENPYKVGDPRHDAWAKGEPTEPVAPKPPKPPRKPPSGTADAESAKETIAFHRSMIDLLDRNLRLEQEDLNRETDSKRWKALAFRVVQLQSDIQAEQDLVASYQTGELVHTRSAFDEFAYNKFLYSVKVEAARADATRRLAAVVEEQIGQLPEEARRSMREKARKILDGKTVASGDVEKALAVAQSLDNLVQGYWQGEAARAEERDIDRQEFKTYVNGALMAAGVGVVGFGAAAFAVTFGETAAATVWAPHILGGIYGGVTGLMTGGPVEGALQAVAWTHPIGFAATLFIEGAWHGVSDQKDPAWSDRLWAGAKQAGFGYLMGKGIEFGAGLLAKGSLVFFGEDNILFKPVLAPSRNTQMAFSMAKMGQDLKDAESLIGLYTEKQVAMARLRATQPAGSPALLAAEKELSRLAASLNSSYHCKWLLKYKAHPSVRRSFSAMVEKSYEETMPEFLRLLEKQGYDVSNLRFKPMRNASSAGSSSMDLDLALQETPGLMVTKNGKPVNIGEFQNDAQQALNDAYHTTTGFSATRSEVNLTTSQHAESYASKALLKKNVNFGQISPAELESIGKVLNVKLDKLGKDPILSEFAKLQAHCRESAKEIDNMLLKELQATLKKASPGSPEYQQIQSDIRYWSDMLQNLRKIGTQETNPYTILEMDRAVRRLTGGKGYQEINRDLAGRYGKS